MSQKLPANRMPMAAASRIQDILQPAAESCQTAHTAAPAEKTVLRLLK